MINRGGFEVSEVRNKENANLLPTIEELKYK
jgi:hypothetical protein